MVVYATSADYLAYTGESTPPAGIDGLLTRASAMLDARVFRLCVYDVDEDGAPTDPLVVAAFRDSVCAQVQWWQETDDEIGTGRRWSSVKIGTLALSGGSGQDSGGGASGRAVAPAVADLLHSPHLTPDVLRIGVVSTR